MNPKNPKAKPALSIPSEEYLQPGDTSGWVPLGQALDALNDSQWTPKALYLGKASPTYLQLEFAVPDGKAGLKTVRTVTVKDQTFEIPGNVGKNPLIPHAARKAVQWLRAEVEKSPAKGSVPKRLPIYGILGFSGAMSDPGPIGEEATKLALALGSNTLTGDSAWARSLGVPQRKSLRASSPTGRSALWKRTTPPPRNRAWPKPSKSSASAMKSTSPRSLPPRGKRTHSTRRSSPGSTPGRVRRRATPNLPFPKADDPWFYYSSLYSTNAGIERYAAETKWLEENAGKDILTGANYSPHANYMVTELQWVRPFKMRGMTMPWSEDYVWQIPEFSVQVTGYQTSGFRAGAKYHDLPIMMYVMPHSPGNTPRSFRLSYYTCIAHGTKLINYFCASPLAVGGTENYVATNDLPMWCEIKNVTHETGLFEDYVVDGKVRPAKVGLLLSSVDEIMTGDTNFKGGIHNHERKAVYYALRHAQVPVDFLTEDDVIDGLGNDYQVIYHVTQQYLHSNAVKRLQKWAEAGGTVVALCGGGFSNEFGQANPDTDALYGVKEQSLFKDPQLPMVLAGKQDLPLYEPLDTMHWRLFMSSGPGLEAILDSR